MTLLPSGLFIQIIQIPNVSPSFIGTDRPTLKDLYKHVTPCFAADWEDIGVYLDIEIGHLKVIKRDNPGDTSAWLL